MKRDKGMLLEHAQHMAEALVEILEPACEPGFCRIAGSIRRLKPQPNDIEIVAIPRLEKHHVDLFCEKTNLVNLLDQKCGSLLGHGCLERRLDKNGHACWGSRIKRAVYFHQGDDYAPLDLFSCIKPAQWGVIYAIRTGPGDFNRLLVTSQRFGGACPLDRKVAGGQVWDTGPFTDARQAAWASMPATKFTKIAPGLGILPMDTRNEELFFASLGIPPWPPQARSVENLRKYLRR